ALGGTFARVRLSTAGTAATTGGAADGEVEDYAVTLEARSDLSITKGDAPDPVIAGETLTNALKLIAS
ncbi:MAG: hypothetical protein F6K22_24860, partial [Okeania sp. SIO2F4]|uniref:hypothetical protein n=1 Tax=Okeania sp. SIO2F4 TaxID=2607790 RepID=UPI0014297F3E